MGRAVDPERWVVARFSALGDVTLATGVLDWWRRQRGWRFVFLTREEFAPVLEGHPAVEEVVTPAQDVLNGGRWWVESRRLAERFRGWGLLDLHGTIRSRLLALTWHGPVRRYARFDLERRLYLRFGTEWAHKRLLAANVPQRYSMAVEKAPPPQSELLPHVVLSQAECDEGGAFVRELFRSGPPIAALHPYATHPDKAWPASSWLELIRLLEEAGWGWFVIGRGAGLTGIRADRDLTNRTDLRRTCALLSHAQVLGDRRFRPHAFGGRSGDSRGSPVRPHGQSVGIFPLRAQGCGAGKSIDMPSLFPARETTAVPSSGNAWRGLLQSGCLMRCCRRLRFLDQTL